MSDPIDLLSDALSARIALAAPVVVAIKAGHRHVTGMLWRPDVVVTSEQVLPDDPTFTVRRDGEPVEATLAGRDPATNVAVLRLASPLEGTLPERAGSPTTGELAVVVGADAQGQATGRLGMVHRVGPAWHSLLGGRIDALIALDTRLGQDEGGPVLGKGGALLGMSTAGPRRRTLVIPAATIDRVVDPLLTEGRIPRGWLGVVLQPVAVPDTLRPAAGRENGMMVTSLAAQGPAEQCGMLPGDILLEIAGEPIRPRAHFAAMLGADRIGQSVALRILRAGAVQELTIVIGARPAG